MLSNMIEFKDFLNYFQNVLNANLKLNEETKILFTYDKNMLIVEIKSGNGISIDSFNCSKNLYNEIVSLLCSSFISINEILIAYSANGLYTIKNDKVEMTCSIPKEIEQELSSQVFSKKKNITVEVKQTSQFEQVSDFFNIYNAFLKRCAKRTGDNIIKISYINGIYKITITNENTVIFTRSIKCSKIKAQYLDKIICENMIDGNSIILSSIVEQMLKIQTPKFCLLIPYNENLTKFHNEALEKMNEYNNIPSWQKVKSSNR